MGERDEDLSILAEEVVNKEYAIINLGFFCDGRIFRVALESFQDSFIGTFDNTRRWAGVC